MKIYKIYSLNDPMTDEIRYIGFTYNLLCTRLASHIYTCKSRDSNLYKDNWVRKLLKQGLKPVIKLIEVVTKDNWQEREKYWIDYYRQIIPNLTNLSAGGINGDLYKKSPYPMKSRNSKKIYQYTLEGDFIKEWKGAREASKNLNISFCTIGQSALKFISAGNFQWRFTKEDKIESYDLKRLNCSIYQYSLSGVFIKSWDSPMQINKILGIENSNIIQTCKNKRTQAGGFIWKYSIDNENVIPIDYHGKRKLVLIDNNIETIYDSGVELSNYLGISTKLISAIIVGKIKKSRKLKGKVIKYAE